MSTQTRATYRTMVEGSAEDYALIDRAEAANNAGLVPRVLTLVEALADGQQAYPVTRLEHSLQSATRAFDDGRASEYVVAALLHDIGDTYAPFAHGAFASSVIAPYVTERMAWIVKVHPEFQQYYYAPHMGVSGPPGTSTVATRGSMMLWSSARSTTRTASTRDSSTGRLSSSLRWSRRSSPANPGPSRAKSAQ